MPTRSALGAVLLAVCLLPSCRPPGYRPQPDTGHGDVIDYIFHARKTDNLQHPLPEDSLMHLASQLTAIEDELRRDGTITVKTPDVWGDGSLIFFIQEYERLLAKDVDTDFKAELHGFVSRSDNMALQSITALGIAASGAEVLPPGMSAGTSNTQNNVIQMQPAESGQLLEQLNRRPSRLDNAPTISLEPTQVLRQHSVFVNFNHALRRRNMVGDNAREPGYSIYKFRIPISVLPGRETSEGYAAVCTFRARLLIDEAHLREMFPRLVIAEAVDVCAELLPRVTPKKPAQTSKPCCLDNCNCAEARPKSSPSAAPPLSYIPLGNERLQQYLEVLAYDLKARYPELTFDDTTELRKYLFSYFEQVHIRILKEGIYSNHADQIKLLLAAKSEAGNCTACSAESSTDRSANNSYDTDGRNTKNQKCNPNECALQKALSAKFNNDQTFVSASMLLLFFTSQSQFNMKTILESLHQKGEISEEDFMQIESVYFFAPETNLNSVYLWNLLIEKTFPVHVFALDPELDEQNVSDVFQRRRLLQLALAINIAQSGWGLEQKLDLARQLEKEMSTIDLNRTVIGFTHGNDTFGWYFRPRLQTPPTESSNIGALARMLWSTGPTERYDMKHRKLEPGIRECEVLVLLPAIATRVAFDVTTNWEKLTKPGVTKRSYEEMLSLGRRVHELKFQVGRVRDAQCYRPGDLERLNSRIEQLEKMLGMQTLEVSVPFEYELSTSDLFTKGNEHLKPKLRDFYGVKYLADKEEIHFFLTGKNFHPTLTHAVIGGAESHSIGKDGTANATADVEVISRTLLRVRVKNLKSQLTDGKNFTIRVATPSGLSNPLLVPIKPKSPSPPPPPFSTTGNTEWEAVVDDKTIKLCYDCQINITASSQIAYQIEKASVYVLTNRVLITPEGQRQNMSPLYVNESRLFSFQGRSITLNKENIKSVLSGISTCDLKPGTTIAITFVLVDPQKLYSVPVSGTLNIRIKERNCTQ